MTLVGKRILVVEDEAMVAVMVEDRLNDLGAIVVGPAGSISAGLVLASQENLDAALLDINVRSDRIDPVADRLRERNVPIVFATGYGASHLEDGVIVIEKPYTQEKLAEALQAVVRPE
jgi:CheY-like chemotaxis protein